MLLLKTTLSSRSHLVCRRHLRALRRMDARVCRRGGRARGAHSVQDAIALRSDDARTVAGAGSRRLRRSLDGRGIGLAEDSGRDGEGHSRRGDLRGRAKTPPRTEFAPASFCSSAIRARSGTKSKQTIRMVRETAAGRYRRLGLLSAAGHADSTRSWQRNWRHKTNWSDSDDLAMMFRGAYPTEFYRALARCAARRRSRGRPRRSCELADAASARV